MGREREGNQTSQRRQHWWLEDGGGATSQGTSRNQKRPGKKKAFSKVSGKEVSPMHTFMLARETHISLLPSRTVL